MADAGERRIRIGVLLDGFTVEHWVAAVLRDVMSEPGCELGLVVLNGEEAPPRASAPVRLWRNRGHLLWRLYYRADERVFGAPDDAFALEDVEEELAGVQRLSVDPLKPKKFEHRFPEDAIEAIRAADLDVILRFGFNIVRGEILESARHGVWSFHHGDNAEYRGGPAFFWEMYEGNPVSGTMLQLLTDRLDGGRVLYRSWSTTDPVSLRRSRNPAFWKSSRFVIRRLRDLRDRGWDHIAAQPGFTEQLPYDKPIYRTPGNGQMLRFLARLARSLLTRRLRKLFVLDQWFIAYRRRRGAPVTDLEQGGFEVVAPPRDRFFADPFVVADGDREYVLFEDYRYGPEKGVISYLELNGGPPGEARLALERDHHLSYPFTFRWEGETWMIPETSGIGAIELYRAERVPDRWAFERTLMDGVHASDATIVAHDGRLWLFASVAEAGAAPTDELFVYWADSLEGPWHPHPLNPIVSDVRRARPAGAVFEHDGALIRPAQDSSGRYGSAVTFHRIEELTTEAYRETQVTRVVAAGIRRNLGTHTYNAGARYEVVDGLRPVLKLNPRAMLARPAPPPR